MASGTAEGARAVLMSLARDSLANTLRSIRTAQLEPKGQKTAMEVGEGSAYRLVGSLGINHGELIHH